MSENKPTLRFEYARIVDPRPRWKKLLLRFIGRYGIPLRVGQELPMRDSCVLEITPDDPQYEQYAEHYKRMREAQGGTQV